MESDVQEQAYINEVRRNQQIADEEKLRRTQQEIVMNENLKGTIAEQLDLDDLLIQIGYLLQGWVQQQQDDGSWDWVAPTDNEMKILSAYGVHLVKNTIQWYLNKNTLLSNYSEETINKKMEDFSLALNDCVFMEYDKVFLYPTLGDCKKVLDERIERKQQLRIYALSVLGEEVNESEKLKIKKEILEETEFVIEKELEKIREQLMKNKLKRFDLLIRCIQDAVHSTYNRAWKGQERTTLRQHFHISETRGGGAIAQPQPHNNAFGWFKKR